MKRGPKPSGKAMTAAQRQARYRAAHAEGEPRLRYCRACRPAQHGAEVA